MRLFVNIGVVLLVSTILYPTETILAFMMQYWMQIPPKMWSNNMYKHKKLALQVTKSLYHYENSCNRLYINTECNSVIDVPAGW
ncbi:hypothetical protein C8J56DRAFT_961201 [Mycena floridula]|nr:hypothetical protein C8J56DRAFT_961201 [Mycena floridula]